MTFHETFKRNVAKKWRRITATSMTKLFVLTSILQTIAVIAIQVKVYVRNLNFINYQDFIYDHANDQQNLHCIGKLDLNHKSFPYIAYDNLFYIMFQLFQLYFCFNAIFHEHVIQIISIAALNFGWAVYGIIQAIEIHVANGKLSDYSNCINTSFDPGFWENDFPCVIILFFFACSLGYISFKFYHIATTVLSIILEFIAYRSVASESKKGMIVFLVLWFAVIIDFLIILVGSIQFFNQLGNVWIFLLTIIIVLSATSVLLVVYGIIVLRNFGSGLKELLQRRKAMLNSVGTEYGTPSIPLNHLWDNLEGNLEQQSKGNAKWSIDD
ncbi:7708_t:CDS:10 [Acaulospora morrowiae]|uniref:7708_t:CDS:1 n=1 Tax=Acaulospora morrowiae TaxID=94023 RepID=A0A9N9AUH2_9GLOM|nr:7708_t:CDS:10 [Acaulospora morrowiae]